MIRLIEVPVEAGEKPFGIVIDGRKPERGDAEPVKVAVVDGSADARERSACACSWARGGAECAVVAGKTIDEQVINEAVALFEAGVWSDERRRFELFAGSACLVACVDGEGVFAGHEASRRDRHVFAVALDGGRDAHRPAQS